jgi:glycosyltransferase involved in cell wall biosynthesis
MPEGITVGIGVPDEALNKVYNSMDLFTLPTGGEGWGLPILEAMAAGTPTLVTDYSGHLEFAEGACETINVAEFDTCHTTNGERAIVDLTDYVMKLDRFYMPAEAFIEKWGLYCVNRGAPVDAVRELKAHTELRDVLSKAGRERAMGFQWSRIRQEWIDLVNKTLNIPPQQAHTARPARIAMEMV